MDNLVAFLENINLVATKVNASTAWFRHSTEAFKFFIVNNHTSYTVMVYKSYGHEYKKCILCVDCPSLSKLEELVIGVVVPHSNSLGYFISDAEVYDDLIVRSSELSDRLHYQELAVKTYMKIHAILNS